MYEMSVNTRKYMTVVACVYIDYKIDFHIYWRTKVGLVCKR